MNVPLSVPWWLAGLNLLLLVIFPIAWVAPLARAGLLPWFGLDEMSVFSAILVLLEEDWFLAGLVIFLALLAPIVKTLALAALHFRLMGSNALPLLEILGKLAMADVFLIAIYIVTAKGVGVGRIETAWGLYLFTFAVVLSMALTHLTKMRIKDERQVT